MKVDSSYSMLQMMQSKTAPSENSNDFSAAMNAGKRPTVAQFMASTGASAKEASTIIYQHKDWNLYKQLSDLPSLLDAQAQLAQEVEGGSRHTVSSGARLDSGSASFEWIRPPEPETPGKVVPHYHEDGRLIGLGLIDGNGVKQTLGGSGDRESFEKLALGVGIGTAGLDAFAEKLGAADFASLDFDNLDQAIPSEAEWTTKYGRGELWAPM